MTITVNNNLIKSKKTFDTQKVKKSEIPANQKKVVIITKKFCR